MSCSGRHGRERPGPPVVAAIVRSSRDDRVGTRGDHRSRRDRDGLAVVRATGPRAARRATRRRARASRAGPLGPRAGRRGATANPSIAELSKPADRTRCSSVSRAAPARAHRPASTASSLGAGAQLEHQPPGTRRSRAARRPSCARAYIRGVRGLSVAENGVRRSTRSAAPLARSAHLGHRPLQPALSLLHAARGVRARTSSSCHARSCCPSRRSRGSCALVAGQGVRRSASRAASRCCVGTLERLVAMLVRDRGHHRHRADHQRPAAGRHAPALARAGLHRVTVSLDALDEERVRVDRATRALRSARARGHRGGGRGRPCAGEGEHGGAPRGQRRTACSRWPSTSADARRSCGSSSTWTWARATGGAARRSCRRGRSSPRIAERWPLRPICRRTAGRGGLALGLRGRRGRDRCDQLRQPSRSATAARAPGCRLRASSTPACSRAAGTTCVRCFEPAPATSSSKPAWGRSGALAGTATRSSAEPPKAPPPTPPLRVPSPGTRHGRARSAGRGSRCPTSAADSRSTGAAGAPQRCSNRWPFAAGFRVPMGNPALKLFPRAMSRPASPGVTRAPAPLGPAVTQGGFHVVSQAASRRPAHPRCAARAADRERAGPGRRTGSLEINHVGAIRGCCLCRRRRARRTVRTRI